MFVKQKLGCLDLMECIWKQQIGGVFTRVYKQNRVNLYQLNWLDEQQSEKKRTHFNDHCAYKDFENFLSYCIISNGFEGVCIDVTKVVLSQK